jgi:hypothetical protein
MSSMMHGIHLAAAFGFAAAAVALDPTPSTAQPATPPAGIYIRYVEPTNPAHRPIYERLKQRKVLEQYQEFLSPLKLPRALQVTLQGCNGVVNAWFDGGARITLCYEYIEFVEELAAKGDAPPGFKREDAIVGPFVQVVLHETSHAIFSILDIPVFGREEDAADELAEFIMLQFGKNVARRTLSGVAFFFRTQGMNDSLKLEDFSDEHGTDGQRFYNALCIAYGSDRETFKDLASAFLPKQRAARCKREYDAARKAFVKLILPHVDKAAMERVRQIEWLKEDDGSGVLPGDGTPGGGGGAGTPGAPDLAPSTPAGGGGAPAPAPGSGPGR